MTVSLLSLLTVALLLTMHVSLWSESTTDRAVQFRSTLDAALQSRSIPFTTATWTNYSPCNLVDVPDYSATLDRLADELDVLPDVDVLPVPMTVARFLP